MTALLLFPDLPPAPAPRVAHLVPGPVRHVSPPRRLGLHDWLYVIYESAHYGLVSDYLWRRRWDGSPEDEWGDYARSERWPRYDSNRSDNGLPAGLRQLWEDEREARTALGIRP
jgi:hypothetical protein